MEIINTVKQDFRSSKDSKKTLSVSQYLLGHIKAITLIRANGISIEKLYNEDYKYIVFKFNPTWDLKREYEILFNLDSISFYSKTPSAIMSSFIDAAVTSIDFIKKENK